MHSKTLSRERGVGESGRDLKYQKEPFRTREIAWLSQEKVFASLHLQARPNSHSLQSHTGKEKQEDSWGLLINQCSHTRELQGQ